jgi:hypothetical protein
MTRNPESTADLTPTARTRVRLPQSYAPARFFPGWGPELGR